MDAHAFINIGTDEELIVSMTALEAAQLVASRHGFYDIDVQPDVDAVKIVATAHKRSVTARGRTRDEACQKLIEAIR